MVVAIANQKGGVGKTSITILFSNYLFEKEKDFIVVDFDFQESLYSKWEEEKELREIEPPYEVIQENLENAERIIRIAKEKECLFLFDLPGKLDDDDLIPVIKNLDLAIIPFSYDKLTFQSTLYFCQVLRVINEKLKILFVPNKVKSTVKYKTKEQVDEILLKFGEIAPPIYDRISIQRLSVYGNSKIINEKYEETFNFLKTNCYG